MREGAAQKVVFFPAETNGNAMIYGGQGLRKVTCADAPGVQGKAVEGARNCRLSMTNLDASLRNGDTLELPEQTSRIKGSPIVVDLARPTLAGCLDIPARPGDVVLIPAAGQVGVYGWVQKPGSFEVTPGMTVLGAVTAAGGAMFSSNAEILRTAADGQRTVEPVNLSRVEKGTQRDIPVEAGDLVLVRASAIGAVPYALSTLLSKFGTGMYFPVP
jgi:hypothetical protein